MENTLQKNSKARSIAEARYTRKIALFAAIGFIVAFAGIMTMLSVHSELLIYRGHMVTYRYNMAVYGAANYDYEHEPAVLIDAIGWSVLIVGIVIVVIGLIYYLGRRNEAGWLLAESGGK